MPALFNGTPKIPTPPPPTIIPQADDAAITAAKTRQIAAASQSSGRVSTILTQPGGSDTLG